MYSPSTKLNLAQKVLVISDAKLGMNQRKLTEKYLISKGQVYNILQNQEEYAKADIENINQNAKRVKYRKKVYETIN